MPIEIRRSFLLWLVAIGSGAVETCAVALDSLARTGFDRDLVPGVGVRLAAFLVAIHVVTEMALGRHWARVTLVGLFGATGTASLLAGATHPLPAACRLIHVAAGLAATVYMFRPAAGAFFRIRAQRRTPAGASRAAVGPSRAAAGAMRASGPIRTVSTTNGAATGRVTARVLRLDTPSTAPVGSAHKHGGVGSRCNTGAVAPL
jgi:hypothetical protein